MCIYEISYVNKVVTLITCLKQEGYTSLVELQQNLTHTHQKKKKKEKKLIMSSSKRIQVISE